MWAPYPSTGTDLNRFLPMPVIFTFSQAFKSPKICRCFMDSQDLFLVSDVCEDAPGK